MFNGREKKEKNKGNDQEKMTQKKNNKEKGQKIECLDVFEK